MEWGRGSVIQIKSLDPRFPAPQPHTLCTQSSATPPSRHLSCLPAVLGTPHLSACPVSRGAHSSSPRLSLQGRWQVDHLGRSLQGRGRFARRPTPRAGFRELGIPLQWHTALLAQHPPGPPRPALPPWASGGQGHGSKHKPHVTCRVVTKSFVSDPGVSGCRVIATPLPVK